MKKLADSGEIAVIGVGAMNLDYICRVGETVEDGEATITRFVPSPGGSAANTIYGLARLGIRTGFIGTVGNDAEGKVLVRSFRTAGVDTSHICVKSGTKTGLAFCFSDSKGRRAIYLLPGANALLSEEDLDIAYLNRARIVHFSSFAGDEQFRLQIKTAQSLADHVKLSLAPGMLYASRGLKSLAPLLGRSYIVFLNREEVRLLTGKDFKAGAEVLLGTGCQTVVVTLGKGVARSGGRRLNSYIRTRETEHFVIAKGIEAKDIESTGAGDAFACGFLFGMLREKPLDECGILGDIVARSVISVPGGRKGFPALKQLSRAYVKQTGKQL